MPASKEKFITPQAGSDGAALAGNTALAEIYKAFKAVAFYPPNHPLRNKVLLGAYQAIMSNGGISLIVQRNGLSFTDLAVTANNTLTITALAKELFSREIQQLTLQPGLSLTDFTEFLSLLSMDPHRIIAEGGMDEILKNRGIQTVIANEIDISAVFTKKKVAEYSGEADAEESNPNGKEGQSSEYCEVSISAHQEDLEIEELTALMNEEAEDEPYRQLARMLLAKGQSLKAEEDFDRLFPALIDLFDQIADVKRSAVQRDFAFRIFQQLSLGEMAEHLVRHLEDDDFSQKQIVYLILSQLGVEVVDTVIRRLTAVDNQFGTKSLMNALIFIGPPAIPSLIGMLNDPRWHIVRTSAAILGKIGSRDAVKGLAPAAYHIEIRVRTEAIRSLAKIGGREATELLIGLLSDRNSTIRRQAITWLGNTRNTKALPALIRLVLKQDPLGKLHFQKKEALRAIGRIGDRQALDPLFRLIRKRHWISSSRWQELKIFAIEVIGLLGGESSQEFLEEIAAWGGEIGRACSETLKTMEQRTANHNE